MATVGARVANFAERTAACLWRNKIYYGALGSTAAGVGVTWASVRQIPPGHVGIVTRDGRVSDNLLPFKP